MTHQRNLILRAAVAAAFGFAGMSAHAGTGSALPALIATQAIKDNTTTVKGNPVTYSTQVPLSANTVYFVYVKLTAGTFASTPTALNAFTSNSSALSNSLVSSTSQTLSADSTFAVYTLHSTTVVIPVNTTISFTPHGTTTNTGEINGLAGLLGGGNTNAVISIGSASQTTTPLADIDSAAGGNIITFTPATKQKGAASSASNFSSSFYGIGVETAQINVSGGTGVALTNNINVAGSLNTLNFGALQFFDIPGVLLADQSAAWTIANQYTVGSLGAVITGNFAAAASVYTATSTVCATSLDSSTLNTAKTTATVTAGTPQATSVSQFICMQVDGKTSIPGTQPSIVATLTPTSTVPGSAITFAAVTLYNLQPNGGSATVRAYIPAAATGYSDTVRIINIGQVAATVSVARIDPVTGVIGTSAVLPGGAVAAGGAMNYSASQIETALGGAFASGDRPRLLFQANTSIEAQNYIINPNGTLTTLHSKD